MNHIQGSLGTSKFGSHYSYKFNEKELQETGMYDYGWRQYFPDLGRWNGMDQLSENYLSASPYAYVLNNPVYYFDPDGRISADFMREILYSPEGTTWTNNGYGGFSNNWGGTMDYSGNPTNYNGYANMASGDHFTVPVFLTAKGKESTWSNSNNFGYNSLLMDSRFTAAMGGYMGIGNSYINGFIKGAESTWDYIKGQFFGKSYWDGLANTATLGAYGTIQSINSLLDLGGNIPNYTTNDYAYGAGYLTEKVAETIVLKQTSQINPFGIRGGYGVFGKNGLKIGSYKVEALYGNGPGVPGGTILSMKSTIKGNLLRWDYGTSHANPTGSIGIHSHFRFNIGSSTYGSSAQYPWHAPFNYWNYKK